VFERDAQQAPHAVEVNPIPSRYLRSAGAGALLAELDDARRLAFEVGQPAVAVSATMGKAKIAGLSVEKREIAGPGGFDRAEALRQIAARHGDDACGALHSAPTANAW
jgi:hypothetical protein